MPPPQKIFDDWIDLPPRPASAVAVASSSLDPPETPVSEVTCSTPLRDGYWAKNAVWPPVDQPIYYETCFRHSGWKAERLRRHMAMQQAFGATSSLRAFGSCGCSMWILRSKTDPTQFRTVQDTCKSRWCKPCYRSRGHLIRRRLADRLDDRPVRFLTLTLRNVDVSLKFQTDRLYKAFRGLRQTALWKTRVLGGCAFLEVKIGKRSGLWHPHLHILTQGRYIDRPALQAEWLRLTGDSDNVDIRLVRNRDEVLYYVTKYTTKTCDVSNQSDDPEADGTPVLEHDVLVEAMRALKGRRAIITFGEWRTYKLLAAQDTGDWGVYAHEFELRARALNDNSDAQTVLDAFEHANDDPTGMFYVIGLADP